MEVQKALTDLTFFKKEIEKEIRKLKELTYTEDEKFLFSNISFIKNDLEYIAESIDYLNKPIAQTGLLHTKDGNIYIDDFLLKAGDCIEALIDNEWVSVDIFDVRGQLQAEFLTPHLKDGNIQSRIRMTDEEFSIRQ
ncbi:MAG: hypothetical protein LIP16_12915 [Clostridium sp.]|nr:hypothetical protein [Clostridium sp.]